MQREKGLHKQPLSLLCARPCAGGRAGVRPRAGGVPVLGLGHAQNLSSWCLPMPRAPVSAPLESPLDALVPPGRKQLAIRS